MIGIALLLAAAPWSPPDDAPRCGMGGEASSWLRERSLRPPPPPPSSDRHLPSDWSIERRGDVVVMRDMVGDGFGRDGLNYEGMYDAVVRFYEVFPDEFDFVTVITNQDSTYGVGSFAFYSPMANDVSGIGDRMYDSGMALQGMLFMNAWQYWRGGSDTFTSAVFGQELGHRWGSFVNYDQGDGVQDDILGRDDGHWSYWLSTSNSPMEGNAWSETTSGTFALDAGDEVAYSPLDLYLMGLVPPEDVPPFFLIQDPSGLDRNASSSPEYYASGRDQTASGTALTVTVDDVIEAEGPRLPSSADAPTGFRMAVLLLLADDEPQDDEAVGGADDARARFVEVWEEDTLGLATLDTSLGASVVDPLDPGDFDAPMVVPRAAW